MQARLLTSHTQEVADGTQDVQNDKGEVIDDQA